MSFKISDLQEHNSELLELLTKHLPDMLWVKDINGKYLYANQTICEELLIANDTNEPIGKDDLFFANRQRERNKDKPDWHTFGELCFNSDQKVIESNKALRFEEFGNVRGRLLYLEVFKAPFYDSEGKIIGTVGSGRDITKVKRIQQELHRSLETLNAQREALEYQANHDLLTTLPNRILFLDRLEQSIKLAQRHGTKMALIFLDLDDFKHINDSLGHNIGDKVLVEITKRMKNQIRKSDSIARLGGDEFCIILNDVNNVDDISDIIINGMNSLKTPLNVDNNLLHVGMSVGVTIYPDDGEDPNTLLKNADAAMYKAKENGKNTYSFYDKTMTEKAFERIFLETALKTAIKEDQFLVYFQPQMNAQTNKLVGMEALVRWKHPSMGIVMPDQFIPLAEITGMIIELDRLVIKKALTQFKQWRDDGLNPGKLSMNLAMKQIQEDSFVDFIENLLKEKDYAYENIEFEITETQIMNNPEKSIKTLQKIDNLGISLAIDDFGTGYSSLAYLKRLPISKLKIDRSFVQHLPHDAEDSAITKTIIHLCENLNLKVIAEGVEEVAQKDFMIENGCKYIQGYLYSKPIGIDEMTEFLKKHQ